MKQRNYLLPILAIALWLPSQVSAGAGPAVTGGGSTDVPGLGRVTFGLSAQTHQDGAVSGEFLVRVAGSSDTVEADVRCLDVQGNTATLSGLVSRGTLQGVDLTGLCFAGSIRDNGEGHNSPADLVSFVSFAPCGLLPPETACSALILPTVLEVSGELQVRP